MTPVDPADLTAEQLAALRVGLERLLGAGDPEQKEGARDLPPA